MKFGERYTTSDMDEYDKKFAEMQKYIPFLEAMIERLQKVKDKSREVQLQKMQSLHGILSNSKRKLKIETLQRCEDVLQKLHNKVEKFQGNAPGLHFPKKTDASSAQSSSAMEDTKSQQVTENTMEDHEIHETPASPSPPVSPDSGSQVEPIIIPTERRVDFDHNSDSKPASPDLIETLPTKAPIIIPTERTSNDLCLSPTSQRSSCKSTDDVSFTEWDMLEENENQVSRGKSWQTIVSSNHDMVPMPKLVGSSSLSQKVNEGRGGHVPISMHSPRQMPTMPASSMGSSRRIPLILDKNRLMGTNLDQLSSDSRPESPANGADTRLRSPESDVLFAKHGKNTSPRLKDPILRPSSKPSAPLLLSPPPVSAEPPLSMEDLAELLNEESDNKAVKKGDGSREESVKFKKDKMELNVLGGSSKDSRAKPFLLSQDDIDSESERRWEEIDKHIVKLTSRKCLPTGSNATLMTKAEASSKLGETKGPPQGSLGHCTNLFPTSVDNRNRPPSPGSKAEPRFADNYERHPRQLRENHSHDKDKPNMHTIHCRPDDDMPNQMPVHHSSHQRRQANIGLDMVPPRGETDFRMEGPDYFNRQNQVAQSQGLWPPVHGPAANTNDFCNNQWTPTSNFSGMPNSPAQSYQHPMGMHQEMWNVNSNRESVHIDPHQMNEGQHRSNQFPASINSGIRPLMSPNPRPQDISHIPRPDEIPNVDGPNVSTIQPLISPTRFPVGPQYRNFQGESRPYDSSFDRGIDYPHQRQSWESSVGRTNDVPYRPENDAPCGVLGPAEGPSGSYPRASTPCPWNRDRDRSVGRGRGTYYNERSRGESRNNFNRDARRPERPRDNHNDNWDNCNRFGRDSRNISDRDPRVRGEHNAMNQNSGQSRDNGSSVRDPRLAKDKHFSGSKSKDSGFNERDPRKRSTGSSFSATQSFRKSKEKPKSPSKSTESHRRSDPETSGKQTQDKTAKEKMQSPLESLYGVIDTKAKSAQGYCLQNFKIPKIKRNEPSESPSSSHISEETKECPADKQEAKVTKKEKEDAAAEVSSSSDGNIPVESWNEEKSTGEKKDELKEENSLPESVEDKTELIIGESDSISTTSKLSGNVEKCKKDEIESEGSKSKDEVTQEWIEALIRKSFEFGEGKKFVEQAKFMQKLGEVLQAKKLKKIKKIIESESESSNSEKDDTAETKKTQTRKKRRVIVSDSSDEESLAERLGSLNTAKKESSVSISVDDLKGETSKTVKEEPSDLHEKHLDPKEKAGESLEHLVPSDAQNSASKEDESANTEREVQKKVDVSKYSKEAHKEVLPAEKEPICKTPKSKAKRRNSLEMLQEDIREMFISDDVVAATGHRQCRTQKEGQNNVSPSTSNHSGSTTKKDEPSKRDTDVASDVEDAFNASSKQRKSTKSRSTEESNRFKGKGKREMQRITRQRLKQYNQSSDSEEDQPLALRTELVQNSSSMSNQEPSNEESEMLRRSKRICNKDTIKEPRVVVEKADISKLDCSKVMFDSSSDESFGIDVSELAAAVDISLHPDKQPGSETAEAAEKKKQIQTVSRKSTRKKGGDGLTDGKDDQLTDEESVTSEVSMSNTITSAKKSDTSSDRIESSANEELLSNILVGLVQTKNDVDKDPSLADKGSDADVDDDIGDQLPNEAYAKKSSAKKKKKKCNWQMGIVSKKKRKKIPTTSSPKGDAGSLHAEMESSAREDTASTLANLNESGKTKADDNAKNKSVSNEASKNDKTVEDSDTTEKQPPIKDSVSEESPEVKDDKDKIIGNAEKSIDRNKEEVDKAFYDLDIKQLIDYAWTGQERYKCLLCFFTGKSIVHHYKLSHPGKEILISRLKVSDAQLAIKDARHKDIENTCQKPLTEGICELQCRFCSFFTEGDTKVAMEAFYEHCTTHTGEYRFRCNSCPYQAVAKSSMRTHYYKVCRRFKDTFAEAITEDEIPAENGIYGYLCSNCNYVQLKRNNVVDHVQLWHEDDSTVKIIKINMSSDPVDEESDEDLALPEEEVKPEILELDATIEQNDCATSVKKNSADVTGTKSTENSATCSNVNEEVQNDTEDVQQKTDSPTLEKDNSDKEKSPQTDTDSSLSSGNLSVFVCPPELEKKEVEIQLERKRKMQEIIQNIGIKLQKDASKKGLSIIDKLKDKMKPDIVVRSNEIESCIVVDSSNEMRNDSTNEPTNAMSSEINVIELPSTSADPSLEDTETNPLPVQETTEEMHTEHSHSQTQSSTIEIDPPSTADENNAESKVKDPLSTMDQSKNDESDIEVSDTENVQNAAPIYESDSSSEQSDGELPTDVNMLLKETSNIDASTKDPMLTTIQRLAAQLQATKPIDGCKDVSPKEERSKKSLLLASLPKPPDVVPITSIKKFIGKMENRFHEISQEMEDDGSQPKNFIRLRRLSGDMLSIPTLISGVQEEMSPSQNIDVSQLGSPDKIDHLLKTEEEEECSFLKIENVVSLAPSADNDGTESPIISDIRKAVEISPIKSRGVSVLKKSNSPLILKRLNTVTIAQSPVKNVQAVQSTPETVKLIPVKSLSPAPVSVTTTQLTTSFVPIAPKSKIIQVENKLSFPVATNKSTVVTPVTTRTVTVNASSQPSNLNYKILKVVRSPTILKPKEPPNPSAAAKLKSAEAYNAMLKAPKLIHLYKCMGRDCRYTTDVLNQFHQHYLQHMCEAEKRKAVPPFDFQKCAYCHTILDDWTQMKQHIEEKHAHCRYQCISCFYRAIAPSYVQIHQTVNHPGHHGILLGKLVKDVPLKEEINRHDYVYPYVCQHDCGKFFYVPESFVAHLRSKPIGLLSSYKCHVCRSTCVKIEQLLVHYKTHGYYKYQCLYCLNGADTFTDMNNHLSTFHANRLPQVLERSLPIQAVRNKDVIDQLLIRTLDDSFKTTEEIIDVESDGRDKEILIDVISTTATPKILYRQMPREVSLVNKEDNVQLNKSLSSLFGTSNAPNSSLNVSILSSEKSLIDSCNDNATNKVFEGIKDSEIFVKSVSKSKESTDRSLVNIPKKSSIAADRSSMEPLDSFEGTFDCSDEFININILDNPDFLKKANNFTSDATVINSTINENKTEDSDIEIVDIDETEIVPAKSIKSEINRKDSVDGSEKIKVDQGTDDKREQLFNDDENSSTSTDSKKTTSSPIKIDQPMTLEDIKDTGFSGATLYKCGNEKCDFRAQNAALLRIHLKDCTLRGDDTHFNCAHCNKRFMKIGFLLEHLKSHGLKRFGCSLCKMRCTVGYQAMAHMKAKHRYAYSKLVPADPKNPSVDGLFIVQPVHQNGDKKGKKRKSSTKTSEKESEKTSLDVEKFSFSPEEINSLPRQAIYNREVQCAVCPYTTKVRMNIIRHLQLHAKDESVPESGPVNPVPCLDKKERMFDKMVNLASSSHQNGRMGGKVKESNKDNEDELIPKFVPEHKRYVCGVAECNYLTVDEAMLRCHLKALHSEEQYFRCPHCPQLPAGQDGQNIAIDKMGVHLKMHDTRLYKCSHCNHHHYHRHVVERHLSDKHPEKRPFVKVIRELENTENTQQPMQEEIEDELPDPDGNHWKCNICDYKCVYKAEMVNHATVTHDEKCQYKCTSCSFKTSAKIMFEQHLGSKHPNDPNVDYTLMYQRIKGMNKKSTESVEQGVPEEPFDTTPLWRRDMPRVRHIRGILLEEENETSNESSAKLGKRKSDAELHSNKPAKIKPGKSGSLDDSKQTKEKSKRSLSCDKVSTEEETANQAIPPTESKPKETKVKPVEDNDSNESDVGRFGPYGKSDGNMYVCTLCTQFKTKYKHDMRDHLYRELNYARWHCKECGYLSVNRNGLLKHFNKHHNGDRPNHEPLSPDNDIEEWVGTLLKRQTLMIKGLLGKLNISNAVKSSTVTASATGSSTKSTPAKTAQSTPSKTPKPISVSEKSNVKNDKTESIEVVEIRNETTKKNETPIVKTKEKEKVKEKPERIENSKNIADADKGGPEDEQEKPFVCKHCKMTFTRWRGFKLHIQLTHLKRLGFICPYCDRSTNSETLMRQHIRSKHPGCPEKIVENPAAGGPELPEDFWQQEYGIVFPKRSRKRKRKISSDEISEKGDSFQIEPQEKCNMCNFTAMNTTGLKIHMRVHASKTAFKCVHCSFTAPTNTEVWEHWELTHPLSPFKVEEISVPDPSDESTDIQMEEQQDKTISDDYSNDIEEERVTDVKGTEMIYYCFYCSFRSKSLDAVQKHWGIVHSEQTSDDDSLKTKLNYPFRYKEVQVSPEKSLLKSQCLKTESPYEFYLQQSQNDIQELEAAGSKQEGWICQWCNELCDSEVKMKTHHNMFHSHLPLNFKKQDKNKISRGYVCPHCSFTTTFINVMKNHVSKHINLFKCKYCDKTFSCPAHVSSHNVDEHPGMELKIESIQNYEALVEKIMTKVKWQKSGQSPDTGEVELEPPVKINAVAKKSTSRNAFRSNIIPYRVKAVARKSTNPHSRYLANTKVGDKEDAKSKAFSYYGVPRTPVNLAKLNTYMVVGGHRMKVNCTTLAQLININPQIVLKDLKHDVKNLPTLNKLK